MAAARLGYRVHVFAPEADGPASCRWRRARSVAPYEMPRPWPPSPRLSMSSPSSSRTCRRRRWRHWLGRSPAAPGGGAGHLPGPVGEKAFLQRIGVPVAPFAAVAEEAELPAALAAVGLPAVLKTTRLGYDGRGQAVVRSAEEARWRCAAWPRPSSSRPSCPRCRRSLGLCCPRRRWPQRDLCDDREPPPAAHPGSVPRPRPHPAGGGGGSPAACLAVAALGLVGVAAVEFFLLPDGRLLGNEIAPRPHSSFHWTIEACRLSQFEAHIRAVAGLPLFDPGRHHDAAMTQPDRPRGHGAGCRRCWPIRSGACISTARPRRGRAARWAMPPGCGRKGPPAAADRPEAAAALARAVDRWQIRCWPRARCGG